MRFLDLDLDAFLSRIAHNRTAGSRLDPAEYIPWAEDRLRCFLEQQCLLSTSSPIPGRFAADHDAAFDFMRELVVRHGQPLEVVHIDGHADIGMGQSCWVHMMKENLQLPVADRYNAQRGSGALDLGSWLIYAVAARFVSELTYVHPVGGGGDLMGIYFRGNNTTSGWLELKVFDQADLGPPGHTPVFDALLRATPVALEPPVPFARSTLDDYQATVPFQVGFLCQSPSFTPHTSDPLIQVIGEYLDFN